MLKENIEKLELHYRTFSEIYKESALEGKENYSETLGRLIVYYNFIRSPIYLFDNSLLDVETKKFTIMSNDKQNYIEYSDRGYFYKMLFYKNNYYILTMAPIDEIYDTNDMMNVYV
ncbi:MAG: hypothetical protein ACK5LT_07520 [Lachnospirales bacterium]